MNIIQWFYKLFIQKKTLEHVDWHPQSNSFELEKACEAENQKCMTFKIYKKYAKKNVFHLNSLMALVLFIQGVLKIAATW